MLLAEKFEFDRSAVFVFVTWEHVSVGYLTAANRGFWQKIAQPPKHEAQQKARLPKQRQNAQKTEPVLNQKPEKLEALQKAEKAQLPKQVPFVRIGAVYVKNSCVFLNAVIGKLAVLFFD